MASRKLYVAMAETIANHVTEHTADVHPKQLTAIHWLVNDLCRDLERDNANFDKDRFMTACGLS